MKGKTRQGTTYPRDGLTHKPLQQELSLNHSIPVKDEIFDDLELATLMQLAYNAENDELTAQMRYLLRDKQEIFECGICFETLPLDDVASLDGCQHQFCRDCLRSYVSSKIEDRRYPISCPVCSVRAESEDHIGCKYTERY